jgi:hypothetical protein
MVRRISRTTLVRDLELGGHWTKLAERGECLALGLASDRLLLCSEGNRHQPAPLLAYTLELA